MVIVKTHAKGQIIMPKDIRVKLGTKPGKALYVKPANDLVEISPLPDDPIDFLIGIFENNQGSMAAELLKERKRDKEIDEANPL